MESKRIYILGAGSSIAHSKGDFPSIKQFFIKAREEGADIKQDFGQIVAYIKKITGRNIATGKAILDIESLFTNLEIDIEKRTTPTLLEIRQQLLMIIKKVLYLKERKMPRLNGDYNNFSRLLNVSDTIITFNWDLLLDNVMGRESTLGAGVSEAENVSSCRPQLIGQYNEFIYNISAYSERTIGCLSPNLPYNKWNLKKGVYLKLHGSIDWFYCLNEKCRAVNKVFPLLQPLDKYFCSECHESLETLLIPPVLNKDYRRSPFIRKIWNIAGKELSSASEVIIWGYGLPPTDFYATWLLRQARTDFLKKLVIINPRVISKKGRLQTSFVRKIYNIFLGVIKKGDLCLYESFSDFTEEKDVLVKYELGDKKEAYKSI
ncbi:MAG: hypothetical protein Q8L26_08005 [Candidatus Omnitrophota bacterium]|nr:hypothetical protein [Candidatus Omnitrophota bacterium]